MSNKSSESSQRDLTTMEYVILGLLSAAPQSGYTLIHTMEMTESRWRVSSGAIYPALKRLEHRGLIAGEIAPSDNIRQRKVYHVTGGGEAQLNTCEFTHQAWQNAQFTVSTLHQQLLLLATTMEWKMQLEWIKAARETLLDQAASPSGTRQPALTA